MKSWDDSLANISVHWDYVHFVSLPYLLNLNVYFHVIRDHHFSRSEFHC